MLPTYDEAENLEAIVGAARAALPAGSRVLIVDDASPDGTGAIADRLAAAHGDVEVLHRTAKRGPRPRLRRRLQASRSPPAPTSSCRWTPTSPTTRPTCRG